MNDSLISKGCTVLVSFFLMVDLLFKEPCTQSHPKNAEKSLVTLDKIPVYAESAVLILAYIQ